MHVFEAALYFMYYIILLLDTTTKPTDNLWCMSVSLENTSAKFIYLCKGSNFII